MGRLEDCFEYVRGALKKCAERRKRYYDTSKQGKQYEEGELVWLYSPQRRKGKSPKLQRCWDGPFRIIRKINDILYQIRTKKKLKVVHYNNLKGYNNKGLEVKSSQEDVLKARPDESPNPKSYVCADVEAVSNDASVIGTEGVRLAKPGSLVNSENFGAEFLVSSGGRSAKPGDLVYSEIYAAKFPVSFGRVRPDKKPDGLVTSQGDVTELPVISEEQVDQEEEIQLRPKRASKVPSKVCFC
jgi:hypothetical protein